MACTIFPPEAVARSFLWGNTVGCRERGLHLPIAGRDGPGSAEKRPTEAAAPKQAAWTPSERVLALTTKQIVETRERLSVVVEQDPSNKEPIIGPIESFDDMVRLRFWCSI